MQMKILVLLQYSRPQLVSLEGKTLKGCCAAFAIPC